VQPVRNSLGQEQVSERRVCRVLGQPRSNQRRQRHVPDDEPRLIREMMALATQYGRYGYRRVTKLLHRAGWHVNHKRVERLWRQEGLKVPQKQPKRRRLWLNDGSCVRLRPAHQDHVWSYDFVQARTHDGRAFRMLTIVDEFTRECLAIDVARKLSSEDVLERLSDLFIRRGVPDYLRSDNGPEFTAKRVKDWLERVEVKTLFIEPGSPWENGYVESFNGKLRDETLKRGDLRHALGGKGADRALACGVQHDPAAQCVGVSAAGARSDSGMEVQPRYARLDFHACEDRRTNITTGTIPGGRSVSHVDPLVCLYLNYRDGDCQ